MNEPTKRRLTQALMSLYSACPKPVADDLNEKVITFLDNIESELAEMRKKNAELRAFIQTATACDTMDASELADLSDKAAHILVLARN